MDIKPNAFSGRVPEDKRRDYNALPPERKIIAALDMLYSNLTMMSDFHIGDIGPHEVSLAYVDEKMKLIREELNAVQAKIINSHRSGDRLKNKED